jgi:hypothetical protein
LTTNNNSLHYIKPRFRPWFLFVDLVHQFA